MSSTPAPTESRRERTRKAKIQSILDTAMALVVKGGIEGLTIHGIARKLDWAVGALYRYFPSKDALLAELQCRVIGEYRNAMETVIGRYQQAHPGNPLGALILIASHYAKYLLEHEAHFRLISLALTDPKQYLPQHEGLRVMEEVQPVLMHIAQEFVRAHAQELLSAKDSAACTLVFWTAVQGTLSMKKLERFAPEQLNNERLFHHTLLTLFTAWGASSKEVEHEIAQAKEWLQ